MHVLALAHRRKRRARLAQRTPVIAVWRKGGRGWIGKAAEPRRAQNGQLCLARQIPVANAKVLVLGLTFKENCPDIRNTKVIDIINELQEYDIAADVFDPWVDSSEAQHEYGITSTSTPVPQSYSKDEPKYLFPARFFFEIASKCPILAHLRCCAVATESRA